MSDRYILLITRPLNEDFTVLEPEFKLVCLNELSAEEQSVLYSDILPNTEAILATGRVPAELIAKALKLKVIVVNGSGYDDIDVAAASALHIPVYNIPDTIANNVAEVALSMILDLSHRITELDRRLHDEPKSREKLFTVGLNPGNTLSGKTLGIIGMGNIGTHLARSATALGMNIVYYQRTQLPLAKEGSMRYLPFYNLLAVSDFVSINCPLSDSTYGMFDERAFQYMKQGACLINTARGEIVDQDQMIRFLSAGRLGGLGLDVYPNNSDIDPRLFDFPNVILTPHIGSNTLETRAAMADRMCRIARSVCNGGKKIDGHLVNPDAVRPEKDEQDA